MRKFRAPIERWHLVIGLVIAVSTPVLTMAFTYGRDSNRLSNVEGAIKKQEVRDKEQDVRMDKIESGVNVTGRNIVKIGQALKIEMEPMPK